MQQSVLTSLIMPIAIGTIMLGLGLSLTIEDFRRVVKYPKAIAIALVCQMFLLPVLCFFLVRIYGLPPALAVGLLLVAASPGGPSANLYSHLSNGDVALNISLTAINSFLSLFTLPLIVNLALRYFMDTDQYMPMQFQKVIEVFAIVLLPATLGMVIRGKAAGFAARMDKPVKILSALFLAIVIVTVAIRERALLVDTFTQLGIPVLLFNALSLAMGYFLPQLFRIEKRQAIAIGMEIGIHNATLAIFIALNVLNNPAMSLPPALYGLLMFFTAAVFGFLVRR